MRGLRWRPEPGLSGWLARSRRNLVIRTSCGPPDCWPRMRAITDRALAIQAWQTWPRERCARSSPRMRSNRTGYVYYLERRDPEFEPKMAEVLCVYREVEMRRAVSGGAAQEPAIVVISYDEQPGIQ